MTIDDLKQRRVGIAGYGREGRGVAHYLIRHGITPVLFDARPFSTLEPELQKEVSDNTIVWHGGVDYLSQLTEVEVLFRSPGIWRLEPAFIAFEKAGGIITSQTQYFFDTVKNPIIGVTGTKGKGTTTSLIYELAKAAGHEAYLTGNIGAIQPLDFIDKLSGLEIICYEMSSFQLQDLTKSPHIGVVLMTTADHLDVHESLEEYHAAKKAIVAFQNPTDFAILNKDFPASVTIGTSGKGQKFVFGETKQDSKEKGLHIVGNTIEAHQLQEHGIADGTLLKLNDLTLRGSHNLQNVAAALLAGCAAGFPIKEMLPVVKQFKGLEHRLEFVTEKRGIRFYNDSFSTTPETAIAGIKSFEEPLFVILGGSEKNLDYGELAQEVAKRKTIAGIFVIGEVGPKIITALETAHVNSNIIIRTAPTLEAIFEQLHFLAESGSVVLLSPGTASFDMFKDYKERGQKFKQLALHW